MFFVQLFFATVLLAAAKSDENFQNLKTLEEESPLNKLHRILTGYQASFQPEFNKNENLLNKYRKFIVDLILEANDLCSVYNFLKEKQENGNFDDESEKILGCSKCSIFKLMTKISIVLKVTKKKWWSINDRLLIGNP